jgi:hypothetical protein
VAVAAKGDSAPEFIDAWLLDVVLPRGGYVIGQIESYFDESGSHSGSPVLCVAGYVLSKRNARLMSAAWLKMLKRYRVSCFHMVDCAHGNEEFADLTLPERIEIEKEAISLIKKYTFRGLAVTINEEEFRTLAPSNAIIGSSYTLCSHVILAGVAHWLSSRKDVGRCAYFFEAGHASQREANRIMKKLFDNQTMVTVYRYDAHTFLRKENSAVLQAADMLAWQWYTDRRHQIEGKPRRADCKSLMEHPHEALHLSAKMLTDLAKRFAGREPTAAELVALHLGDRE